MKCILIVLAIIACNLSSALANNHPKAEKAHSAVMAYVQTNMGGLRMMRSNRVHLECYNGFLPLINSLAIAAKEKSYACVLDADDAKNTTLSGLDRTQVAAEVKKITDSLEDCSSKDGLDYFVCLENNAETNRQLMENVKNMSMEILAKKQAAVAEIDDNEQSCIMDAVDSAKSQSDAAFSKLKSCINGEATFENVTDGSS